MRPQYLAAVIACGLAVGYPAPAMMVAPEAPQMISNRPRSDYQPPRSQKKKRKRARWRN